MSLAQTLGCEGPMALGGFKPWLHKATAVLTSTGAKRLHCRNAEVHFCAAQFKS